MKRSVPMGKSDRISAVSRIAKRFKEVCEMSDDQLFAETKRSFPILKEATRDECIRMLMMDYITIQLDVG